MVWSVFSRELQEVIKKRFDSPTSIQKEGIPQIHAGKNVLIIAPTGIGKTETALLPIFDLWLKEKPKPISMLYITPLKSLNRDLMKRILWWSEELGFDVSVRHGDTSQYERSMQAANPSDIFISTPETLQAILVGKVMRKHLANVRWVIIDEIHELVDNKRGVQLSVGLERLKNLVKNSSGGKIQIVGLSATVGSPENVAEFLTGGHECKIINISEKRKIEIAVESPATKKEYVQQAEEMFITPETFARLKLIYELIGRNESVLTFTNTREFAEILSSRLRILDQNFEIETHHSSLSKDVRIDAEERFKQGKLRSLVCTSSLELGIDIGSINLVLQYMSPRQVAKLLQRVGRSGHKSDKISRGVVICSDPDDCFESAVIAKLGLEGKIEPTNIYLNALDVLAHQIIGLALEEYRISADAVYSIVKRSYPYRNLTKEDFVSVCKFLNRLRLLWINENDGKIELKRTRSSWEYYYTSLSTIPDVKNYKIIDIFSNKPVGSLDAEFVALHGSIGQPFICKGQSWRIVDLKQNSILVEPSKNMEAAIPAWEGELIPIPYDVAQEVGRARGIISEMLKNGRDTNEISAQIKTHYPISSEVAKKIISSTEKQYKHGFVPDEKTILIENWENYIIIHSCFGSLINDTLGRIISIFLTNKVGSVGLETDPYRIIIKFPERYRAKGQEILDVINEIKPETIEPILEMTLPSTELFRWRFINVAQRFGVIERNADYTKDYIKRILLSFKDTPLWKEALNEVFHEKLDIPGSRNILVKILEGGIPCFVRTGLSNFGEMGLTKKYEIMPTEKPEGEIFELFKKRLLETKLKLLCCNCGEWSIIYRVKDIPENIQCPKCQARLIGVIKPFEEENEKILKKYLKKQSLNKAEEAIVENVLNSGSLVITYGKKAAFVLAGRGIGVKTASRILSPVLSDDDLIREILKAEKKYIETKRFWKE